MCRWIAYVGAEIPIRLGLVDAQHSLIVQSRAAAYTSEPLNGDGFGVGWYSSHVDTPGVYRDIRPAWNDENFLDLATHIRTRLFLAHIRATTGTSVQRTNCHPFRYDRWIFQHNGLIPGLETIRRELLFAIDQKYFSNIRGTTDSELIFHLALTHGLESDPKGALERTVTQVLHILADHEVDGELQFSASAADGESLYAVRYSNQGTPRTLYYATELDQLTELDPHLDAIPEGSIVIVSEPLGPQLTWNRVEPSTFISAGPQGIEVSDFRPG
jgi:glutamine amidotransferase